MAGDVLARGGRSATFGPATNISQAKWDSLWADEPEEKDSEAEPLEDSKEE